MITKIKLGAIVLLLFFAAALLLSNYAIPGYGPIFGLKRFQENAILKTLRLPAQKADFESTVLDKRLSELKYLVENQKIGYLLTASLRYSATAGKLTDIIKQNVILDKIPATQAKFREHQKIIEGLMAVCQKNDNTECKYIQDDANYLKIYSDNLSSK